MPEQVDQRDGAAALVMAESLVQIISDFSALPPTKTTSFAWCTTKWGYFTRPGVLAS